MTSTTVLRQAAEVHRIRSFQFAAEDVISTANAKMRRVADILKAVALQDAQEVVLVIRTCDGVEKIQTKIVAAGDDFILTNSGYSLPIRAVEKIEFSILL